MAHLFFIVGAIRYFAWTGTSMTLKLPKITSHEQNNGRFLIQTFVMLISWILFKPVIRGWLVHFRPWTGSKQVYNILNFLFYASMFCFLFLYEPSHTLTYYLVNTNIVQIFIRLISRIKGNKNMLNQLLPFSFHVNSNKVCAVQWVYIL